MKPTLEQIKTDESVWPEGATHCIPSFDIFYKSLDGSLFIFNYGRKWLLSPFNSIEEVEAEVEDLIPRPAKAFVPEVGVECEFDHPELGWTGCEPIGRFRGKMVCAPNGGGFYQGHEFNYRPIKSEREKFIEAVEGVNKAHQWTTKELAEALYDAGFKAPEVTKD